MLMMLVRTLSLLVLFALASARANAATIEAGVADQNAAALADAVVSLTPVSAAAPRVVGASAAMDQRGLKFVPQVLAIQTGTAVKFPNSDQVRHHVYSFSPIKKFELRLYKDTPSEPLVFDQAGVATIGCNIHDWMLGYIVVVDTPFFAKTGADGSARIDVPAGVYDLRVWHARADEAETRVAERVLVDEAGLQRQIARTLRAADPEPPPPSELEQKFRKHQKAQDDGA